MKSLPRLTLALALWPASVAFAADADVYRELLRYRIQEHGIDAALDYTTSQFLAQVLEDPQSPYSDLIKLPGFTNDIGWNDLEDSLARSTNHTYGHALRLLQKQTGLTKARPGVEVNVTPPQARAYHGREAAANAIKAGVDVDIFFAAWDKTPQSITAAAGRAVALQMYRSDIEDLKRAVETSRGKGAMPTRDDCDRQGLDCDLVTAYLAAPNANRLNADDLATLASRLGLDLEARTGRVENGVTQLPAAYRVARVTAAYVDAGGSFSSTPPCKADGDPTDLERSLRGSDAIDDGRPLCFVGATDRAVHSWYRERLRSDAMGMRQHENTHHTLTNILNLLGLVMTLGDLGPLVEAMDAAVVGDIAAEHEGGYALPTAEGSLDSALAEPAEAEVAAEREAHADLAHERYEKLKCRIEP